MYIYIYVYIYQSFHIYDFSLSIYLCLMAVYQTNQNTVNYKKKTHLNSARVVQGPLSIETSPERLNGCFDYFSLPTFRGNSFSFFRLGL